MAVVQTFPLHETFLEGAHTRTRGRVRSWIALRWLALVTTAPVLGVVAYVQGTNNAAWPGYGNDDEGTYMARAWAVLTGLGPHHGPANYTYWYDHPPLGWMQISAWAWLTHTFRPGVIAVASGREMMLFYALASTALVYVIVRRVGAGRVVALGAMALFGCSPLSVEFLRSVYLDGIGLPWVLASFALALSPRRRLIAFVGSGLCFGIGVLSKETFLLLAPALLWQVFAHADRRQRRVALAACGSLAAAVIMLYPLFALLKGEFFPGRGHVSLLGGVIWQLSSRTSSGSIFTHGTDANNKLVGWLQMDPWLLSAGVVGLPVALALRRSRPIAAALAIPLATVLRPGYLPYAFVVGILPFSAITAAVAVDRAWRAVARTTSAAGEGEPSPARPVRGFLGHPVLLWTRRIAVLGALGALAARAVPEWNTADQVAMTTHPANAYVAALHWVERHVPRSANVLVDDDMWIDLVDDHYRPNKLIWFWELNDDPMVQNRFPGAWRQMDYVISTPTVRAAAIAGPRVISATVTALAHSHPVAIFGTGQSFVSVLRVSTHGRAAPPWWLPGHGDMRPPTSGPQKGEKL